MADRTDANPLIAAAVSRLMRERGLTLEAVVDATGITYGTLHRRLSNVGKTFDLDELARIARLLDMSLTALITYAEAAEPAEPVSA
jgi:transcriptional regulator with XRE-family HTH domain